VGPESESPPLIVEAHEGPTADAKPRLELRTQFFTSRGFGVAHVKLSREHRVRACLQGQPESTMGARRRRPTASTPPSTSSTPGLSMPVAR
jgi:hypothetical protein